MLDRARRWMRTCPCRCGTVRIVPGSVITIDGIQHYTDRLCTWPEYADA